MVWLLLKTSKIIMANRIPNVPSWFFFFFESEKGKKNSINACHKDRGDQVYKPRPKGL